MKLLVKEIITKFYYYKTTIVSLGTLIKHVGKERMSNKSIGGVLVQNNSIIMKLIKRYSGESDALALKYIGVLSNRICN